jgi:hypothetical protein
MRRRSRAFRRTCGRMSGRPHQAVVPARRRAEHARYHPDRISGLLRLHQLEGHSLCRAKKAEAFRMWRSMRSCRFSRRSRPSSLRSSSVKGSRAVAAWPRPSGITSLCAAQSRRRLRLVDDPDRFRLKLRAELPWSTANHRGPPRRIVRLPRRPRKRINSKADEGAATRRGPGTRNRRTRA